MRDYNQYMRWVVNSLGCLLVVGSVLAQSTALEPAKAAAKAVPQPSSQAPAMPLKVAVAGTDFWVDSGLDLRAGDEMSFAAEGVLELADGKKVNAAGASRGFRDLLRAYPVNAAGQGALIGRIGDEDSQPFLIGPSTQYAAQRAGRLFLSVNKAGSDAPSGSFDVTIDYVKRAPEVSPATDYKLAAITTEIVDRFPRRVTDADGNAGDNTNFLFVGSEEKVMQALKAAGWVEVDRSNGDAVVNGILSVLNKEAYLTLPMSELTLFGRSQDHGMAHAEPIQVVATRHHFRIWKAPFAVDGQQIWVGAGTHDIGFDRDNRNNGVTHKIDPDVDAEREYIGKTVQETGLVVKEDYVTPSNPSKEALTATGASFHSDGRMLVIYLVPDPVSSEQAPAVTTSAQPLAPPPPPTPGEHIPDAATESIFPPIQ